ncbi:hypothetical protein Agub_g6177 [Astrephomene gubernaculifera]|uniref:Protein kinase domain-containing protein n=1 Tax=Astrephomene gubernaculifera TaxID=47775 RepID=A0AAD3DRZ4_9CHLO|nr:hypothetical protein Agub_g6177 [Astrephomene gubernaculifera]
MSTPPRVSEDVACRTGQSRRASEEVALKHTGAKTAIIRVSSPSSPQQGLAAVEGGDDFNEKRHIRRSLEDSAKMRQRGVQHEQASLHRARVAVATDREPLASALKSDIRSVKVLGEGAFGIVDLVRVHTGAGPLLCVRKKLLKASDTNPHDPEREVEAMTALRDCPFLTQLWSAVVGLYDYTLLLEYCPYGTLEGLLKEVSCRRSASGNACLDFLLSSVLRAERKAGLTEDEARFYTACVLIALEDMHSRGYVHRDVKPSNCLLAESRYLKLSDLGLAKRLEAGGKAHSHAGTPLYMAPEVVHGTKAGYDFSADMWSLGMMVWEMVDGALPRWAAMSWYWSKTLHCPDKFSPELKDLLSCLLDKSPRDRPSAASALSHRWFSPLDLPALRAQQLQPPEPAELEGLLIHARLADSAKRLSNVEPRG